MTDWNGFDIFITRINHAAWLDCSVIELLLLLWHYVLAYYSNTLERIWAERVWSCFVDISQVPPGRALSEPIK